MGYGYLKNGHSEIYVGIVTTVKSNQNMQLDMAAN